MLHTGRANYIITNKVKHYPQEKLRARIVSPGYFVVVFAADVVVTVPRAVWSGEHILPAFEHIKNRVRWDGRLRAWVSTWPMPLSRRKAKRFAS